MEDPAEPSAEPSTEHTTEQPVEHPEADAVNGEGLLRRMRRASLLDDEFFEEVREDPDAFLQAMAVVVLAAIGAGIGNYGFSGLVGIFGSVLASLLSWYIWAYLAYLIGFNFYPGDIEDATLGDMLRTMGFASAPGILRAFGIWVGPGPWLEVAVGAWMITASVIAVQHTLGYPEVRRAAGVTLLAWSAHYAMLLFMRDWLFAG